MMSAFCDYVDVDGGIASGNTWTGPSRGVCLVTGIYTKLSFPDGSSPLVCNPYKSSGTGYSKFFIILIVVMFVVYEVAINPKSVSKNLNLLGPSRDGEYHDNLV